MWVNVTSYAIKLFKQLKKDVWMVEAKKLIEKYVHRNQDEPNFKIAQNEISTYINMNSGCEAQWWPHKEEEARKYFQQLISAIDYCHSRGVYHRDLKVDSVMC